MLTYADVCGRVQNAATGMMAEIMGVISEVKKMSIKADDIIEPWY
jgi:hypothetical protein